MSISSLLKPVAYLSLPVFALHSLSKSSPIARYYVRLALYISTLSVCSVWGVVLSVGMSLVGRRLDVFYVVARSFYFLSSRAFGIRFEVEGEEYLDTRPAVLVGNHQSMLDIIYLGRIFPRRASIMAKKELQWTPLLGQFMTLSGAVWVDRGNNAKAVRSLTAAGEIMKARNSSLFLFPEGTRSMRQYHDLLPFKKGAFHTAVQAGVPIVPVICENYYHLYRKGVFESGTLKIRVLPPISTKGLTASDVGALSQRVREQMLAALREISSPPPPDKSAGPAPSSAPSRPLESRQSDPLSASAVAALPVASGAVHRDETRSRSESRASTQASEDTSSPARSRIDGSENGTETEEDDGMVLVGRPKQ